MNRLKIGALLSAVAAPAALIAGAALAQPAQTDADMQAVLDAQAKLGAKPIETLTPEQARRQPSPADGVKAVMAAKGMSTAPDPAVTTMDVTYPAAVGMQKARIYKPANAPAGQRLPVVVYYHGGGWVIADLDTYDATPRELAKNLNAIVVSAEYRHAPEAKFPAAHNDAVAAYKWVVDKAPSWGGDIDRIAVAGESAGGNLAANVAIAARDQKLKAPVHQLLIYPVAQPSMMTASYEENAAAKPLNKPMMAWFVKYTTKSPADAKDPRLDLVKADLKGLAPVTVINAQIDPLRSDGDMLVAAYKKAGVPVEHRTYDGVTHEFFGMGTVVADAKAAEDYANSRLKGAFDRPAMASR